MKDVESFRSNRKITIITSLERKTNDKRKTQKYQKKETYPPPQYQDSKQ